MRNIRKYIDDLNVHASVLGLVSAKPNTKLSSFNRVTFSNLEDIIRKVPDKTCSLDPLPTWLLKKRIPVFMPIILETVNSSLESGTFPSCLGQATNTPVLKKQSLNKDSLCNYRPISNIRFLAKVLEKVVAHQLHEYIDLNHLDNPRQSSYKKNYSTETALLSLQNDISRALDDILDSPDSPYSGSCPIFRTGPAPLQLTIQILPRLNLSMESHRGQS